MADFGQKIHKRVTYKYKKHRDFAHVMNRATISGFAPKKSALNLPTTGVSPNLGRKTHMNGINLNRSVEQLNLSQEIQENQLNENGSKIEEGPYQR